MSKFATAIDLFKNLRTHAESDYQNGLEEIRNAKFSASTKKRSFDGLCVERTREVNSINFAITELEKAQKNEGVKT